ncbi:MAG: DUF2061 domain-containing protein [Candidatus Buchananbacteria bacterium]|nr:DUF2061 domain-containing protein [Candidatus Buchananbacteria bacterium]
MEIDLKTKIKQALQATKNYLNNKPKEKAYRSLIKSITWRLIGTLSLVFVTYLFTQKLDLSVAIGGIDIISNLILYFVHERVWEHIAWGRTFWDLITFTDNKKRSLAKAISWRILASLYLVLVSYFLTGDPVVSVAISLIDAFLNIIEYYLHERVWNSVKFGR